MNIFKGTIEKRIMNHVKNLIKDAEQEYDAFVKEHDEKIDEQINALEQTREDGKRKKENDMVEKLITKLI